MLGEKRDEASKQKALHDQAKKNVDRLEREVNTYNFLKNLPAKLHRSVIIYIIIFCLKYFFSFATLPVKRR